jgi:hypothetical protein
MDILLLLAVAVGCYFLGFGSYYVLQLKPWEACHHEYDMFDKSGWHCRFNYQHIKPKGS